MAQQYLSTDPNAGTTSPYLSTDPNAGNVPSHPREPSAVERLRAFAASRMRPEIADLRARRQAGASVAELAPTVDALERNRVLAGANDLPSVGGMVGGYLGGIAGAGAGGALGDAARQVVRRSYGEDSPEGVTDQVTAMGREGALQAAFEGVGRGASRVAAGAGRWFMNRGLNPPDVLAREFPDMADTAIDNALTVSQGGLEKARTLLARTKAEVARMLSQADAAGARVSVDDALSGLDDVLDTVARSSDPEGGLRALVEVERKMRAGRSGVMTLTEADLVKRELQRESKSVYRAIAAGNGAPNLTAKAEAVASMAKALNTAIDAAAERSGVAGYRATNEIARDLIGASRGIQRAIRRGGTNYQALVRPGMGAILGGGAASMTGESPVAGAVTGAILGSPRGLSTSAVLLTNPATREILRQSPRLFDLMLRRQSAAPQTPPADTGAPR